MKYYSVRQLRAALKDRLKDGFKLISLIEVIRMMEVEPRDLLEATEIYRNERENKSAE